MNPYVLYKSPESELPRTIRVKLTERSTNRIGIASVDQIIEKEFSGVPRESIAICSGKYEITIEASYYPKK